MTLLLRTVHGSRLYNLSHANSDWDWFEIHGWDKFRGKQKISGDDDRTRASYDSFMRYCDKGVPQYLEAMFSRQAEFDAMPFNRLDYRLNLTHVRDTYMRTIKAFWLEGWELEATDKRNAFKKRRHAIRLALNLRSMHECGTFDPTLTDAQVDYCNDRANDFYALGIL